ncbi:MAG: hypothetical protein L3K17_05195 [Thermoplasmata archaeon]|nr:hypothetical protein [Thermoplasmata archaeon]
MLLLVVGVATLLAFPPVSGHSVSTGHVPSIRTSNSGATTNITNLTPPTVFNVERYRSSVDGFNLSYDEWLPIAFNVSRTYPLIIYLHGQQSVGPAWVPGGIVNDFTDWIISGSPAEKTTTQHFVNLTRAQGYIFIALNSRSGAGWFVNSPCGGPQYQDVMDAIARERIARHVSSLYLWGTSMGTEGTEYVASRNPGMFKAIGIIAPVTDLFMDVAYRETLVGVPGDSWANRSIQAKADDFCGVLPGTGNVSQRVVARMFQNMSPFRFDQVAFNGTPIYVAAGGSDNRAPNNVSLWPYYMQVNNSFVNSTCHSALALGEPVNCTVTFWTLHRLSGVGYNFRYVFEEQSGHTISQLDPIDMLAYWAGIAKGGYFVGEFPYRSISPVRP